jgi:hypothetical protein
MLKDVFISPQVFKELRLKPSSWKDIKYLLYSLLNSGYLMGVKKKKWKKDVKWNISLLEPKVKDQLMEIISNLDARDLIVEHPIEDGKIVEDYEESGWLEIIQGINKERCLSSIIATRPDKNIISFEELEDININEKFGVTGSRNFILSSENMKKNLLPFLSYAKKLTIIDPYFYVNLQRYEKALNLMAKYFGERRGEHSIGSIDIHCKWDSKKIINRTVWSEIINKIHLETGHKISVTSWESQWDKVKMHDRYLISNQSGLVSAAGTNIDDFQQSEWSIKDYRELGRVLANYKENSSPFNLMHSVSSDR